MAFTVYPYGLKNRFGLNKDNINELGETPRLQSPQWRGADYASPEEMTRILSGQRVKPSLTGGISETPHQPYLTGLRQVNPEGTPQNWWNKMGPEGQQGLSRALMAAGTSILQKTNPNAPITGIATGLQEGLGTYDEIRAAEAKAAEEKETRGLQSRVLGLGIQEKESELQKQERIREILGGTPYYGLPQTTPTYTPHTEEEVMGEQAAGLRRAGALEEAERVERMRPKEKEEPKEITLAQAISKRDMYPVGSSDRKIWENYIQKLSTQATGTTVNVGGREETAGAVEMAKLDAKYVDDLRGKATSARQTMTVLDRMEKTSPQAFSGTFADWGMRFGRLSNSLGIPIDLKEVATSEQYATDVAELVRGKIKALGSGAAISNIDLLFTERSMPDLIKTPEGRAAIIKAMKQDLTNVNEEHKKADAYIRKHRTLSGYEPYNPAATTGGGAGGRVKVVSPDGKVGSIPESQLSDAMAQGYKRSQ